MSYRLGVDVGGTFTDLLLINEADSSFHIAKVPSTPADPSIGVLNGTDRVCELAGIAPAEIDHVMHGSTIATNAILTGQGARVGLVTTEGYRHVLQIARSYVPGGLGAWVIFNKTPPLAPLKLTVEARERIGAKGEIVAPLDEEALRQSLRHLKRHGIDALTISLFNSYTNDAHERQAGRIAAEELPDVPVSLSCDVIPEMQEYERTITTVCNSYVRPIVSSYVRNLSDEFKRRSSGVKLHLLRSDGGLTTPAGAETVPVNLLMSGPAGGVAGALWIARQAGFDDLLTFDMGGTSTDVCLIQGGVAQTRRETTVGDLTVRASSLDVRSVGAGGGSIAHVPALTKALRVGPESAGADPGPAAYAKGGEAPTVTDANVVLGYLPASARLGGDMEIDGAKAEAAVQHIAEALDFSTERAAQGIYDIVNENMIGALRLVSVQQGNDPREFALIAFGGAGPLHGNALARILNCWPVIVPPGPGVLCAYGDATTRSRDEASRSLMRRFSETSAEEVGGIFAELNATAARTLEAEGIGEAERSDSYEVDVRYTGQVLSLPVPVDIAALRKRGLDVIGESFDRLHEKLYTFAIETEREIINLRAIVQGRETLADAGRIMEGSADASAAILAEEKIYADGEWRAASVYRRDRLKCGNIVAGPAIVTQLDSTTLILPGHNGEIAAIGNILIRPTEPS
ncbi:MAG: hydantoinase/oxoprolinase family protein [Alphaproteobacteria bacterium]|jgi:N-methylhydantoinase A|nr:hydantoinase/oxoprolinase family protein [Alphaproteobacteria bacterium]